MNIAQIDPTLATAMQHELERQREGLEMIASENYVHPSILEAAGSVLTNKYSEGYPKARYYGGNQYIDEIEQLAIDRAKALFGAEHANVQPHSGSNANLAAYLAILEPGDKILGMSLEHGGHLTHGHKINISGKLFEFSSYGVDKASGRINMEEVKSLAHNIKPKLILAGASAYSRELDFKRFREIANEIGAYFMVDMAHIAGLVATGLHNDPVYYADIVTTTTHKTLRGPRSGLILCKEKDRFTKKSLAKKIDKAVFPGIQGGPLEHVIAAKALCFKFAAETEFKTYQEQVIKNAQVLANNLLEHDYDLISGGTDNHLLLIDLNNKNISGAEAEHALDQIGIHTNKNLVPYDKRTPMDPSGLRIGTPALTSRGMKEKEMEQIAYWMRAAIENFDNSDKLEQLHKEVLALTDQFPLYESIRYQ